jgi:hypothetical protein
MLAFYSDGMLASCPPLKLEDHPFLAVLNIFIATLNIWNCLLHPQPANAPCHGDKGSTYNGQLVYHRLDKPWTYSGYKCITK